MTKTRAPPHKKSAAQKTAGMESVPISSMSETPTDSSSVKFEYVTNTAEVTGAQVEPSANVASQSSVNMLNFSGKVLVCK